MPAIIKPRRDSDRVNRGGEREKTRGSFTSGPSLSSSSTAKSSDPLSNGQLYPGSVFQLDSCDGSRLAGLLVGTIGMNPGDSGYAFIMVGGKVCHADAAMRTSLGRFLLALEVVYVGRESVARSECCVGVIVIMSIWYCYRVSVPVGKATIVDTNRNRDVY
jgi:hypothetical protein